MDQNQIRNIGIGILSIFIFGFVLILDFSLIKMAFASLAVVAVLLTAFVYHKEQSIVEKIDLYILFVFLGILAIHYDQLMKTFTTSQISQAFQGNGSIQTLAVLGVPIIALIFNSASKKSKTIATRIINKYISMLITMLALSLFFLARVDYKGLAQFLFVFVVFGLIAFCRTNLTGQTEDMKAINAKGTKEINAEDTKAIKTENTKAIKRLASISFLISTFLLSLTIFFPNYSLSDYNIKAFLSLVILPWYFVLGLTLIILSIVGMGLHYSQSLIEVDAIFLTGIVGLIWVVKATVFFFFSFSWIAIVIFTLLFIGFTNRFIRRKIAGQETGVHSSLVNNEFYWLIIAAVSVVASIFLVYTGYVYFWLSLLVGYIAVLYLKNIASGWIKDVIFWLAILFSVSFASFMFSMQNGFSEKKVVAIAALFTFSCIAMWMMNHQNDIGQNKYLTTKIIMAIVLVLLVSITALKAGSHVNVSFQAQDAHNGSLMLRQSTLKIEAIAKGKDNSVKKIQYVWSDSFTYDEEDIVQLNRSQITTTIENNHLIIWAEDENGVVTRKDCWFYASERGM